MERFYVFPDNPELSIVVLIGLSMLFLFLARDNVHQLIGECSDALAGGLRKIAASLLASSQSMEEKSRKVLLESGLAKIKGSIVQEFDRIDVKNTKELSGYPQLQYKLDEAINTLQSDYEQSGNVVIEAPGWSDLVETITRSKMDTQDRIVEKMIGELHKSAVESEKKAIAAYRETTSSRHKILSGMAPVWKRVEKLTKEVGEKVGRVLENGRNIENYIDRYAKLSSGSAESIDILSSQVTKLFIVSLIVIFVGLVGAFINFNLIALPMSELVPAGTRIMGMKVSEVSALVIVALELVLGIFLFESIGVTKTFPQIANMARSTRRIILWGSVLGLLFLSTVEASLAVLREHLTEAKTALDLSLSGGEGVVLSEDNSRITVVGQAILGFVLPWILAVVAIPLEMFIEASQHAFSRLFVFLVGLLNHVFNSVAYLIERVFKIVASVFDIYIIVPSKLALMFKRSDRVKQADGTNATADAPKVESANVEGAHADTAQGNNQC